VRQFIRDKDFGGKKIKLSALRRALEEGENIGFAEYGVILHKGTKRDIEARNQFRRASNPAGTASSKNFARKKTSA
jgi:hypothetical protein